MDSDPTFIAVPKNLQFRVGLLVGLAVVLGVGFLLYALYARGLFDDTQRVTLITDNAEGVAIGMDLNFSGFPIGRVRRLSLDEQGRARILIEIPRKDAHWLRATSVFTLEKGLIGGATIRAHTGDLKDPALPDDAERPVLRGDTTEEIPKLVASMRSILDNIESLTAAGGNLQGSIASLRAVADRAAGKRGALGAILGDEQDAQKLVTVLDDTNRLLTSLNGLVSKTDQRIFAPGGVMESTEHAVSQANSMLGDVREALKRADGILADAEQISGNAKAATKDLATLRAEVDANVRKISSLIDEINRKWPFERKTEIRLP
jgi:phospholipid/cholesterol/gamma-HCH transport system substrate-binding protein